MNVIQGLRYNVSEFILSSLTLVVTLSLMVTSASDIRAQQTVGLFKNSTTSFDGYTLFSPMANSETFLIDNCGELIHTWTSAYRPSSAPYLLPNGLLLRSGNVNNPTFTAGGNGGIIELIDWDGNVVWDYTISSRNECQHHDLEPLPNGNILAIVWESHTFIEAVEAGRIETSPMLWSERIIEIEPDLENDTGRVVWEWRVWDHLVQDKNINAANYGVVKDSPRRIDVNFSPSGAHQPDWLHINSVAYNAELDQIVMSCHAFDEIWIVDHSTTMEEAKSSTGGRSGLGGDLLFRYGNPQAYGQGDTTRRTLFKQHDARWVFERDQDRGKIMIFNNQAGRREGKRYSAVEVIDPGIKADGTYTIPTGTLGSVRTQWTYKARDPVKFNSEFISGAQPLPNGNTLICEGATGRFFEVTRSGETTWEYVNPSNADGIVHQGEIVGNNSVFRCTRYAPDYPGLAGKPLVPHGYIETGSTFTCDLFPVSVDEDRGMKSFATVQVRPQPADHMMVVQCDRMVGRVTLMDIHGRVVWDEEVNDTTVLINSADLPTGTYVLAARSSTGMLTTTVAILR